MPSPFPGVDPYLEDRGFWPDFHSRFLNVACEQLLSVIPSHYDARMEEFFRLVEADDEDVVRRLRGVEPDVSIVREGPAGPLRAAAGPGGGTAVLEPVVLPLPTAVVEVRDRWIEIRDQPDRSPVTVIELLSPANKSGTGSDVYASKRRALIERDVNLVELDFLLRGRRLRMDAPLPTGDCYAFVAHAERRPDCDVYAWSIRRPLPTIPIPLRPPDADVPLDLAAAFALAFERGRYPRVLRYAEPLGGASPLAAEDRAWAEGLARSAVL